MKRIFAHFAILFLVAACNVKIGDECGYDADCSVNMDRNCDNNQPGGYCLIIGCGPAECPEEASCVEFTTPCPMGDGYEQGVADTELDAGAPDGGGLWEFDKCRVIESNRGRTYCLKHCRSGKDCRGGYVCTTATRMSAGIIDFDDKFTKVCVPQS